MPLFQFGVYSNQVISSEFEAQPGAVKLTVSGLTLETGSEVAMELLRKDGETWVKDAEIVFTEPIQSGRRMPSLATDVSVATTFKAQVNISGTATFEVTATYE